MNDVYKEAVVLFQERSRQHGSILYDEGFSVLEVARHREMFSTADRIGRYGNWSSIKTGKPSTSSVLRYNLSLE